MTGAATADVLVTVPGAQLHKVERNLQTLLVAGPFTVSIVGGGGADAAAAAAAGSSPPPPPAAAADLQSARVEAAVGGVAWPLGKHLPALKAAPTIYSFAADEAARDTYLILVLPQGTPRDVLEAVDDVLHDSCALSTAKQVDAAYEEADKLTGGKEASALRAAEVAGAAPAPVPGTAAAPAAPAPAPASAPAAAGAAGAGRYALPSSGNAAADAVANGLLWTGTAVAGVVGKAASATAGAIQGYTQRQMEKGAPPPPDSHATISPTFKRGLALAGTIASTAAYVTGRLAALVGQASYATALAIAKSLPGHKKRGGGAGAGGELVSAEERSALQTVGAAGLVAFVEVYDSLERAAKDVLGQSGEATSAYIAYKYGPEAGDLAARSVPVAQDMLSATINFSRLGARAFISKTAKHSAKVYLKSTVAGIHPDEQRAGIRAPSLARQQPGQAAPPAAQAAAGSSSNLLAQPYPAGPAAAAAAQAAGGSVNTAGAQQAARAGAYGK